MRIGLFAGATKGIGKLSHPICYNQPMNTYKRHRFPPDIISYASCFTIVLISALEIDRLQKGY
jgi:hypothetical protein